MRYLHLLVPYLLLGLGGVAFGIYALARERQVAAAALACVSTAALGLAAGDYAKRAVRCNLLLGEDHFLCRPGWADSYWVYAGLFFLAISALLTLSDVPAPNAGWWQALNFIQVGGGAFLLVFCGVMAWTVLRLERKEGQEILLTGVGLRYVNQPRPEAQILEELWRDPEPAQEDLPEPLPPTPAMLEVARYWAEICPEYTESQLREVLRERFLTEWGFSFYLALSLMGGLVALTIEPVAFFFGLVLGPLVAAWHHKTTDLDRRAREIEGTIAALRAEREEAA